MDGRSILDSLEAELEEIYSLSSSSQTGEPRVDVQIMQLGDIRSLPSSPQAEATRRRCISRVPDVLKGLTTVDAFAPQLVSLGPYHHGQARLRAMDYHKVQALYKYLNKANKSLAQVTEAMRPHLESIKSSYVELDEQWRDEERFLKLMILDGCFFLDAMVWKNTPLSPYMVTRVNMDMLRLENQLPLLVLAFLIEHGGNEEQDEQAFKNLFRGLTQNNSGQGSITDMGMHHLDLNRKCRTSAGAYLYNSGHGVLPATKLKQSGVRLARSKSSSFKDISFSNGVLRLPFLEFMDNTETLLLNFLAYEQIFDVDNAVTSYAFLMDNLIDTADDVVLLRERGVFRVSVGSDEDIATLFNSLTKTLALNNLIFIACSYGGTIKYGMNNMPMYVGGMTIPLMISESYSYIDLVNELHGVTTIDPRDCRLKIICNWPITYDRTSAVEISNDHSMSILFNLSKSQPTVELFIETVPHSTGRIFNPPGEFSRMLDLEVESEGFLSSSSEIQRTQFQYKGGAPSYEEGERSDASDGEDEDSATLDNMQFVGEDDEENLDWPDKAYVNNEYVEYEEPPPDEFEDDEWVRSSTAHDIRIGESSSNRGDDEEVPFRVGELFETKDQLVDAIRDYSIKKLVKFKQIKSNRTSYEAICFMNTQRQGRAEGNESDYACPWKLYAVAGKKHNEYFRDQKKQS
ncbi:uncharacterized protein LOC109841831 [Asparagus officinalis]|uniref:uncharacterized protein LOC109841831 n=1 Tax=Asparagus officinalis TaxID=4686 RepID=UPI00098DFBD7|nr:uncharacterized protein LOC109841831 [Asparagus officinalis]